MSLIIVRTYVIGSFLKICKKGGGWVLVLITTITKISPQRLFTYAK